MRQITFADFAKLASKRGLMPEYLAERFANKIERPSEFFHRVFQGQYAAVVIPYRSVLAFYASELEFHQASVGRRNVCACGCKQPVFDRQKWASPGCRQRKMVTFRDGLFTTSSSSRDMSETTKNPFDLISLDSTPNIMYIMYQHDSQTAKGVARETRSFTGRVFRTAKGLTGDCDPNGKRKSGYHAVDGGIDRVYRQGDPK